MRDLRMRRSRGPGGRETVGAGTFTTTAPSMPTATNMTTTTSTCTSRARRLRTHTLDLEVAVLAKNDQLAERNRTWLAERGIAAVNLMSSPGAGKTTLLERTIKENRGRPSGRRRRGRPGDPVRRRAHPRRRRPGGADQHRRRLPPRRDHGRAAASTPSSPSDGDLVVLENVGNLVCPALFDLGETSKVVIISVTEGDDKPLKYPHMFAAADLVVVNKTDLLPYVDFDVDRLRRTTPAASIPARMHARCPRDRRRPRRLVRLAAASSESTGGRNVPVDTCRRSGA